MGVKNTREEGGALEKKEHFVTCDTSCGPGREYRPPAPLEGVCCGQCVQVGWFGGHSDSYLLWKVAKKVWKYTKVAWTEIFVF